MQRLACSDRDGEEVALRVRVPGQRDARDHGDPDLDLWRLVRDPDQDQHVARARQRTELDRCDPPRRRDRVHDLQERQIAIVIDRLDPRERLIRAEGLGRRDRMDDDAREHEHQSLSDHDRDPDIVLRRPHPRRVEIGNVRMDAHAHDLRVRAARQAFDDHHRRVAHERGPARRSRVTTGR